VRRVGDGCVKKVYAATDPADAHLLKGLLESESIPAEVHGEHLYWLRGDIPMTPDTCPSVWVVDDADFGRAVELLRSTEEQRRRAPLGTESWRCRCGEENERQFTDCWKCGRLRSLR